MFNILFTDAVAPAVEASLSEIKDASFSIEIAPSQEQLAELVAGKDAVIIRSSVKIDRAILKAGSTLKVIGRAGVGVDNVDLDAATEHGVIVLNTPRANTIATAECTVGLMLALARNIPQAHQRMREGGWDRKKFGGIELHGKSLGLVGLGRVGAHVAKLANAFGMQVSAYDPYIDADVAAQAGVTLQSLDDVLASSDFISLHALVTPETKGMINAANIAKMKPGTRLINAARGALMVDDDVIDALQSGQLAGAAIDTYDPEPLPVDSLFRSLPTVITTPHIAASTAEAQLNAGSQVVERVMEALRGEDYGQAVNRV